MRTRNGLHIVFRAEDRHQHRVDIPSEARTNAAITVDIPPTDQPLISEVRGRVRVLLADLANEDLGSALLDLSALRRVLEGLSPDDYRNLDLG